MPEVAGADGIVVDEAHPVEAALAVGGRVERRVGDRVVEGHAVDRRDADRPGDGDDLGPRPVGERVVGADRRQAEVGAVVGEPEDEARGAARPAARSPRAGSRPSPTRRGRPTRMRARRQPEVGLGPVEQAVDEVDLLGVLDLREDDRRRAGAASGRRAFASRHSSAYRSRTVVSPSSPGGRKKRRLGRPRPQSASTKVVGGDVHGPGRDLVARRDAHPRRRASPAAPATATPERRLDELRRQLEPRPPGRSRSARGARACGRPAPCRPRRPCGPWRRRRPASCSGRAGASSAAAGRRDGSSQARPQGDAVARPPPRRGGEVRPRAASAGSREQLGEQLHRGLLDDPGDRRARTGPAGRSRGARSPARSRRTGTRRASRRSRGCPGCSPRRS